MSCEQEFSFLVTTDNHMGYKESDHLRRKDSYMAFKEALQIARDNDVDFVLLGGDLFHYNQPSTSIEHKCIKIIRQHMNASARRTTSFRRTAGNFSHFSKLNHANFEDVNLNVPCPIMTIHGNHDDPTGPNAQSICEKLATCGLLNYFGAVSLESNAKSYSVEPIVLEKGKVKIALYGIGFIPDYKLKHAFDKGQVDFVAPPTDSYNILVVHQNRVPYNKSKYIPDEVFPPFFHLVIRGHEHDTQAPEALPGSKIEAMVYQPGSTVATSISPLEGVAKKVGLIRVKLGEAGGDNGCSYKMEYELISLSCCRKMLFKDISKKELFKYMKAMTNSSKLHPTEYRRLSHDYVNECIASLLNENASQSSESSSNTSDKLKRLELPLVRIRLEYTSKSERFNESEISAKFYPERVANRDIILFKKQRLTKSSDGETKNVTFDNENYEGEDDADIDEFDYIDLVGNKRDTIEAMIEDYFKNKPSNEQLQVLSVVEYTNAVKGSSEDGNVISKVINKKKKLIFDRYKNAIKDEDELIQNQMLSKYQEEDFVQGWFLAAFGENEGKQDEEIDVLG